MTTTRVTWIEEQAYLGVDANGRGVIMSGKEGPGVNPMQMLLLGLGGCTLYDVVTILQKQRQPVTNVEVEIDGKRGEGDPSPWTAIHLHYVITGETLDPGKVERAVSLSVEKYCGAHASLAGVADITHDHEIRQPS